MKYVFFIFTLGIFLIVHFPVFSEIQRVGSLDRVAAIPIRPEWNQFKILVWQYKTSVLKDIDLYRRAGMGGFHIDRGAGKNKLIKFSIKERFPYYVDHVADKGILYLKGNNANAVIGKHSLATRPHSLSDPGTIEKLKQYIARNIGATQNGMVLAQQFPIIAGMP